MTTQSVQEALSVAFFKHAQFTINGELVELEILARRDGLLPSILFAVDHHIATPQELAKLVNYQIISDPEALCGVTVTALEVIDKEKLITLINDFDGVYAYRSLLVSDNPNTLGECYELAPFCRGIMDQAHEILAAQISDKKKSENCIEFIDDAFIRFDELEDDPLEDFDITSIYQQLDFIGKRLIEELAIVTCADYLAKNSDQTIETLKEKSDVSLEVEIEHLQAALLTQTELLGTVAKRFQCQAYQLIFDSKVYQLRANTFDFADSRSFGDPTVTWYFAAKKQYRKLSLSKECQRVVLNALDADKHLCLDKFAYELTAVDRADSQSHAFTQFYADNHQRHNIIRTTQVSFKMRQALNRKVIGQAQAIENVCQGYLTSTLNTSQGPRAIYTFVGSSGVGKTYLASQLLEQLRQHERTGYELHTFNMEHYANERDGLKLFGAGVQFVDANLGMLTQRVRSNPRQIVLFDEIEKAHTTVIQSLLSLLDSGVAKDQTSQEAVDFSQCIIIFTTNLGQEALTQKQQDQKVSVFDILKQSTNPANKAQLSPEFVNRLAKGYATIFNPLKVNHFIRLAEMELDKHQQLDDQIQFNWADNFAQFLLKTLSPDMSVRALSTQVTKLQSQILSHLATSTDSLGVTPIKLKVEAQNEFTQPECSLLFIDDDDRSIKQFEAYSKAKSVELCRDLSQLSIMLKIQRPDALLIDLSMLEANRLTIDDLYRQYLNATTIPLFTYRLSDSISEVVDPTNEVREHFELTLQPSGKIEANAFKHVIKRVQYYVTSEKVLTKMFRRRESMSYRCQLSERDSGLRLTFEQTELKQLIDSHDIIDGELFNMTLPSVKFSDVIGLERAKERLEDVLSWIKLPEKLSHFGVSVPSGFLLVGPSGTGKTFLAKAIAGESGLPFFAASAAELSSSHVGGTTENIKKLFATARKYAPAIVFIDEIDAIAMSRTQGASRDSLLTVNTLLTEMDGFASESDGVFVMAATNHPELLDSAILRPGRFDEVILCDLPNSAARKQFFTAFARKHDFSFSGHELNDLVAASQGMSSAEIEQVFRETIYESIGQGKDVNVSAVKQTMIRVSYGRPNENIVLSEQEKLRTAYHEAGHLLASVLLFPQQEIDFVTIEPRNQTLGFVATRPLEEYEGYSKNSIDKHLQVLMAGRAAEQLFTESQDEVSSGASNDINKATKLAMHAVYEGGLDPSIGPINITMLTKFEESELLLKAQQAVQTWLTEAENRVLALLSEHHQQLEIIAHTLHQRESLLSGDIKKLIKEL
ncbi:AAA family ATPase [Vibrio rotiferianus]|uniref:AAA family ATPase n=1 Tax=Vibrio rotiferianus TaxID=190895 RepID=UPI0011101FFA|nr:AAA family ATPase [Vibrio rotiferianus]TMX73104.1 AAA family ATPase [Vibrio rotiferianus]